MVVRTTYSEARANLARPCDRVPRQRETIIIKRHGARDVAVITAEELSGIQETIHLLRSPPTRSGSSKPWRQLSESQVPLTVDE
jgi:prevent-host-death family protein